MKEKLSDFFSKFKIHSKSYLKTNILFMTFVITSLLNGCLLRFLTVRNFFAVKPIIADLAVILIIGAFGYFIKPKHQFKYFFTWGFIFTLACIINSIYYTNYLSFVSFSLIETSLQLVDVTNAVTDNVMEYKDFCFVWQLLALLIINKKLKKVDYYEKVSKIEKGKVRALNTLVAGLIAIGVFISTLTSLDIGRLVKQWNREYIVMQFGIYTYQLNDLFVTLKAQLNPLFGYDESAKAFREYYSEIEDSKTNEYTGIFEGKNVIAIHAESMQNFLLNTSFNGIDVTPNLKKLASEGIYFSNFYSQESVGTSSDSEFTYNTSLLPATSGTVFVNYWDRDYVTIPKLLKEKGYYTFSMHANKGTFWNRNNAHKSLGYDDFYYYTKDYEIDETIGLGLSDKSFFRQSTELIKKISESNSPFYGVLLMLSNHTPFTTTDENGNIVDVSDYDVTMKYNVTLEDGTVVEKLAPYMDGTTLGSYFKSAHYADEAIGLFIEQLDAAGLLENTVLVIYGDHDSKLKKSEYRRFYNYVPETNSLLDKNDPNYVDVDYYSYELNREVPFIIWTKDRKFNLEVTEVMGMYDIMPTLGNMLGIKNEYAIGTDMFSLKEGEENVVVFPDGNWLTNKMYYSQSKNEGKLLNPDDTVSIDYINKYTEKANKAIEISDSIIVFDLIKKTKEQEKLLGELNENEKTE